MKYSSKDFLELQEEWYNKIKALSFNDLEVVKPNGFRQLKPMKLGGFTKKTLTYEYYSLATEFAYSHKFNTGIQKQIWTLHAEGKTYSEIIKLSKRARTTVHYNLHKVGEAFNKWMKERPLESDSEGVRYWSEEGETE